MNARLDVPLGPAPVLTEEAVTDEELVRRLAVALAMVHVHRENALRARLEGDVLRVDFELGMAADWRPTVRLYQRRLAARGRVPQMEEDR
jgi:hypothetical protein